MYLAEKYGVLLPKDAAGRWTAIQWVFWQMAGLGPQLGQLTFFAKFSKEKVPMAIDRCVGKHTYLCMCGCVRKHTCACVVAVRESRETALRMLPLVPRTRVLLQGRPA